MRDYTLSVGYKQQKEWVHAPMWLEMTFGGVFCGMFIASVVYKFAIGAVLALCLAVAGKGILLLADLGRPGRFLKVLSRPGSSWISRGTWGFAFFGLTGVLTVAPVVFPSLPWSPWEGGGRVLSMIACAFAVFVMVYDGFFLADSKGIAIWSGGNLPVLFGMNAALGGVGALMALAPWGSLVNAAESLPTINFMASVLTAICLFAFIIAGVNGADGAKHSIERLLRGDVSAAFWVGVVLCGIAAPFVASLIAILGYTVPSVAWITVGAAEIIGVIAMRYSVLKCGTYSPTI